MYWMEIAAGTGINHVHSCGLRSIIQVQGVVNVKYVTLSDINGHNKVCDPPGQ